MEAQVSEANKPLVLIIDDEESICSTLSNVLEDENFVTVSAASGMEGVSKVAEYKPSLVFLDIWMPGWDGLETLERIKLISPHTEVVMVSGHASISNALEAKDRGAFDFIEKPLDIDSILVSAKRALRHREEELAKTGVKSGGGSEDLGKHLTEQSLSHEVAFTTAHAGKNLGQRTLKKSAVLYGQGLHSGIKSGLILEPLPANSGIHFSKIGGADSVPASVDFVESTAFATTLRNGTVAASTIEHLMAALHAYKISNLLIKCNDEVPILDGSASEFCKAIEEAGIEEQQGDWFELRVPETVNLTMSGGEELVIEPSDEFSIRYELNYPEPVGEQAADFTLSDIEEFKKEVAPARTFGFMKDVEKLQKAGLAAGGRLDNFIPAWKESGAPIRFALLSKETFANSNEEVSDEVLQVLAAQEENFIKLYPNPFQSDLIISYKIESPSYVEVRLNDIHGNNISTLEKGKNQKSGKHTYFFDGTKLKKGPYIITVIVNNERRTRIIIKN